MRERSRLFWAVGIASVLLGSGSAARAAGIANPVGLAPGSTFYVIDLTSATTEATSDVLSTYNTFVENDAAGQSLTTYNGSTVTWDALVSIYNSGDPIDADSLFDPSAPIYNVAGQEIAANGAALWGVTEDTPLLNAVSSSGGPVFTGTSIDGTTDDSTPLGYPSGEFGALGTIGSSSLTSSYWIDEDAAEQTTESNPIYGFSSALTAAPEPAALSLLALGALALLARRRRLR